MPRVDLISTDGRDQNSDHPILMSVQGIVLSPFASRRARPSGSASVLHARLSFPSHLLRGDFGVEALSLGLILGLSLIVFVGLVLVALFHYLGSSLSVLGLTFCTASFTSVNVYPAFAQSLFERPREATGKIVCANCHLGTEELQLSFPQGVLAGDSFEVGVVIPVKKTNAQVQSDGSIGPLQVGGVLVLPENLEVMELATWSYWSNDVMDAVSFGPLKASHSAERLTLTVDRAAFPSSVTVYGGGNRGRGQIYPDGRPSNITSMRQENGGITVLVSSRTKRYGNILAIITVDGDREGSRLEPGQSVDNGLSPGSLLTTGDIIGYGSNMGGFGISEGTITIQSGESILNYLCVVILLLSTQLGLVFKKKQFDRMNL